MSLSEERAEPFEICGITVKPSVCVLSIVEGDPVRNHPVSGQFGARVLADGKEIYAMSAEFIVTLGDASQVDAILNGKFLMGRSEPRIAMVGRSNVGKSSLINALTRAKLAKTSGEPGKTRAIHFYYWKDAGRIIADLPGYGYANVPAAERERWAHFIAAYLKADRSLEAAIVLLDARHGPTDNDREAIDFLWGRGIPMVFVFTKADSIRTQSERIARRRQAVEALQALGIPVQSNRKENEKKDEGVPVFWVSSKSRDGLKALELALSRQIL